MEWNRERVITLLKLYRERPVLWNQAIPEFKDKNKKDNAWNEISREMKIYRAEIQTKMRNIISQFHREVKRAKSDSDDSKRKWFAYPLLQFLKDKKTDPPSREPETVKETEDLENGNEVEIFAVNENASGKVEAPTAPLAPPLFSKRASKRRCNPVTKVTGKRFKTRDEFDLFAEYIASQLRKCANLRNLAIAKQRMNQVLFELEMSTLNNQSNQILPSRSGDSGKPESNFDQSSSSSSEDDTSWACSDSDSD